MTARALWRKLRGRRCPARTVNLMGGYVRCNRRSAPDSDECKLHRDLTRYLADFVSDERSSMSQDDAPTLIQFTAGSGVEDRERSRIQLIMRVLDECVDDAERYRVLDYLTNRYDNGEKQGVIR